MFKQGQVVEVLRQVQPEVWRKATVRHPETKIGIIVEWKDENGKIFMTTNESPNNVREIAL